MLNEVWLLVSALLVLIGLLASNGLLLVVGSLVVVVWVAARVWQRHGFRNVSYVRTLSRRRAFIGDTIEYTVELNNDKVLPLIWVDIHDSFPEGLELPGATVRGSGLEHTRQHTISTSLLPYQRVTWKYEMRCVRRGYHRIGPVRMRSGDIFGFSTGESRHTDVANLLVYPRVVDLDRLRFPPEHPFGQVRGRLPLYYDNNRVMGQRDYRMDDPLKHIDWKATARARQLQTKVFEPTVSLNVLIAMNGSTSDYVWEASNRRLFERAVTAAASAAVSAEHRGYSFGLVSNAVASYSGKWLSVPVGGSPDQLTRVLEALAMAAPYVVASLPEVFRAERNTLPPGATVLFVASAITDSLIDHLTEIRGAGYRVSVLYSGDGEAPEYLAGIPVASVGRFLDSGESDGEGRDWDSGETRGEIQEEAHGAAVAE